MKNKILLTLILGIALISFLQNKNALATVGGPKYVSEIAYNPSNNSIIYYKLNDNGGMGCPPIIHSISVVSGKDTPVKNCNNVLSEFFQTYDEKNQARYSQFISDTYQGLHYLSSVNLKSNHIGVEVDVLSENIINNTEVLWTEFRATIKQNNKEIAKLDFRGCSKDQPHLFEGYRVPDTNTMAILISNKGDCFEGGYVTERLFIIEGVNYYDTNPVRPIKTDTATEPNTGNLVVYADSQDLLNTQQTTTTTPTTDQKNSKTNIILFIVLLVAGIAIGYTIGKKSIHHSDNPVSPKI